MQKHKWLTKWSSQYGKCLFKTKHNEKQGDGQNLVFVLQYLLVFVPVSSIFCDECLRFDWLVMEGICADSLIVPTLWSLFLPHTQIWEPSLHSAPFRKFGKCSFWNYMFCPLCSSRSTKAKKRKKTITDTWRQLKKNNFHTWWQDDMSFFWKHLVFCFFRQPTSCTFLPCWPK